MINQRSRPRRSMTDHGQLGRQSINQLFSAVCSEFELTPVHNCKFARSRLWYTAMPMFLLRNQCIIIGWNNGWRMLQTYLPWLNLVNYDQVQWPMINLTWSTMIDCYQSIDQWTNQLALSFGSSLLYSTMEPVKSRVLWDQLRVEYLLPEGVHCVVEVLRVNLCCYHLVPKEQTWEKVLTFSSRHKDHKIWEKEEHLKVTNTRHHIDIKS